MFQYSDSGSQQVNGNKQTLQILELKSTLCKMENVVEGLTGSIAGTGDIFRKLKEMLHKNT